MRFLPPSHDHPTHIKQTLEGWVWSCPELKLSGGPHDSLADLQQSISNNIRLPPNRGMVWVYE